MKPLIAAATNAGMSVHNSPRCIAHTRFASFFLICSSTFAGVTAASAVTIPVVTTAQQSARSVHKQTPHLHPKHGGRQTRQTCWEADQTDTRQTRKKYQTNQTDKPDTHTQRRQKSTETLLHQASPSPMLVLWATTVEVNYILTFGTFAL